MIGCDPQLLGAYLDDELSAEDRARAEAHLHQCTSCARELSLLRDASRLLTEYPFQDITKDELKNVHDAIDDDTADRPIWRIGGAIGVIAASVLIVSCAWLWDLPVQSGRATVSGASVQPWEHVAMTLRADPLRQTGDDATQLADAHLADWMLSGLANKVER